MPYTTAASFDYFDNRLIEANYSINRLIETVVSK